MQIVTKPTCAPTERSWKADQLPMLLGLGALLISSCGPAKMVNLDKRFARYYPVYEATRSDHDAERFEALIEDLPEHRSMARVSLEVPFPAEEVWRELVDVWEEQFSTAISLRDHSSWALVSDPVRVAHLPGGVYQVYNQVATQLSPTRYGTTVIHTGLIRWTGDSGGQGIEGLQVQPEKGSFRYALVGLGLFLETLDSEVPLARYAVRNGQRRERYERARIAPAELRLTAELDDSESWFPNGTLDPGEPSRLRVTVSNSGRGSALDVRLEAETESAALSPDPVELGEVPAGESKRVTVPLEPDLSLSGKAVTLSLQAFEGRGYHSKPLEVVAPAAPLVPPSLRIRQVVLRDDAAVGGDGDGRLGTGERVVLETTVENAGGGPGAGVTLTLRSQDSSLQLETDPIHLGRVPAFESITARMPVSIPVDLSQDEVTLELVAEDARGGEVGEAEWSGTFPVVLRVPLVEVEHRVFDGNSPRSVGNRDGIASNGEWLELELQALNRGRYAAEELRLAVEPAIEGVQAVPPGLDLGSLPAGSEARPERVVLRVPRRLDAGTVIPIHVRVRQRRFPEQVERLDLPFQFRSPDLRIGPTEPLSMVPGRVEERSLTLVNLGSMDAENVRLRLRSAGGRIDVLEADGSPSSSGELTLGSIPASPAVREIPLSLFARRGAGDREEIVEVTVEQADFPPRTQELRVAVVEEAPERIRLEPDIPADGGGSVGPAALDADRAAPNLWLLEPEGAEGEPGAGRSLVIMERQVRVRGRVHDASGVYEVRVNDAPAPVGPDGEFSTWVRLAYGSNLVTVKATDVHRNTAFASFEIERRSSALRASRRRDRAVIFATGRYDRWPALANPVRDAQTVRALLESLYGFEVELVVDPTQDEILQTLRRYAAMNPGPQDQLLVFFAGHGHYDEEFREGYVVARDSLKSDEVGRTYVSHSRLATILDHLPHRHVLVVLDVCFGGTFDQRLSESRSRGEEIYGDVSREEFIRRRLETRSRLYLTSGGKEYVPDGLPGRHSPFARRVIEALNEGGGEDRVLTLGELYGHLEKLRPEPRAGSFGQGEPDGGFLFVRTEE